MGMKALKVATVLCLLGVIISFIWSFFYPKPYSPYSSFMMVMSTTVIALEILWPGFKAFLRALPLAVLFLLFIFWAFLAFMDIRTKGFTLEGLSVYILSLFIIAGYILSIKRH
jgi:hypothetical protein